MSDQVSILAQVINHGFDWVYAREQLRRMTDSKRASAEDVKRATRHAYAAASKLEKALIQLMKEGDHKLSRKKSSSMPVDWSKVAGAIAKGAGAIENALNRRVVTEVIDTEGKEVP